MIICWRGFATASDKQKLDTCNAGYVFGGEIPQYAASIKALKGCGLSSSGYQLEGKHLATMKYKGHEYNWSLYVPDRPAEDIQFYNTVVTLADPDGRWNVSSGFSSDMTITDKEEFNKWVLGMMAEISDDGIIPPEITYENILKLCQDRPEIIQESY